MRELSVPLTSGIEQSGLLHALATPRTPGSPLEGFLVSAVAFLVSPEARRGEKFSSTATWPFCSVIHGKAVHPGNSTRLYGRVFARVLWPVLWGEPENYINTLAAVGLCDIMTASPAPCTARASPVKGRSGQLPGGRTSRGHPQTFLMLTRGSEMFWQPGLPHAHPASPFPLTNFPFLVFFISFSKQPPHPVSLLLSLCLSLFSLSLPLSFSPSVSVSRSPSLCLCLSLPLSLSLTVFSLPLISPCPTLFCWALESFPWAMCPAWCHTQKSISICSWK